MEEAGRKVGVQLLREYMKPARPGKPLSMPLTKEEPTIEPA